MIKKGSASCYLCVLEAAEARMRRAQSNSNRRVWLVAGHRTSWVLDTVQVPYTIRNAGVGPLGRDPISGGRGRRGTGRKDGMKLEKTMSIRSCIYRSSHHSPMEITVKQTVCDSATDIRHSWLDSTSTPTQCRHSFGGDCCAFTRRRRR